MEDDRKIVIFQNIFLMQSLDDPSKWETYNNFNGEPFDWVREMERIDFSGKVSND